jgi:sphingomyelin phosphodiesterase 2
MFSRFPIVETSVHPYSLNGAPIDVAAGDWFVGKAAASIVIEHPVLRHVQVFNTHVSFLMPLRSCSYHTDM